MRAILFGLSLYFFGSLLFTMAGPVELTRSISQFSTDLYQTAIQGTSSNIIMSPFSVHMALTLAFMGANGKTADELLRGLRLSGTRQEISQQVQELIEPMQNNQMLKVANKVYVMDTYNIKKEFDVIAKQQFHSEAEKLNFAKSTESANTINTWVEEKTNDKIKDLIDPKSLGVDTRMVLVNAIYFKGLWKHQFKKERTAKAPFYTSETDSVDVDMMHVKQYFRYGEFPDIDAKGLELPYKDSDMSMFIILPNLRTGLAKLETNLKNVDLNALSRNMFRQEVDVSIPKFKIEFKLSLVDTLKKMGMSEMFSDNADFSDLLDSTEPLKVSDVVHKAFIEVNEEGVEAAAATGIVFMILSAPDYFGPTIVFKADHPFTFILKKKEEILFIGKYNK